MNRIRSIDRLISATSGVGLGTYAVENQVARIKERLKAGNDEEGVALAPLKNSKKQPLSDAANLLNGARYDVKRSSDGFEQSAVIGGQAGTILVYQDRARPFAGWGTDDRSLASDDLAVQLFSSLGKENS